MSSEALPIVEKFFETAGDDVRVRECLDPEVVWFGTRGGLDEAQVLRGPDEVLRYMAEIQEPWERYDVEVERLMEVGDGVVALMRETARHGGLELHNETAMIFRVERRRIVEMRGYLD